MVRIITNLNLYINDFYTIAGLRKNKFSLKLSSKLSILVLVLKHLHNYKSFYYPILLIIHSILTDSLNATDT